MVGRVEKNFKYCRVERVEVKDVRLPQQLQRAMAAEAEGDGQLDINWFYYFYISASRQARAKVIEAEGEQKGEILWDNDLVITTNVFSASKALKEASDIISSSSSALQLRWVMVVFVLNFGKKINPLPLRYLQTLSQIAAERNSTIVFPLPIELMVIILNLRKKDKKNKNLLSGSTDAKARPSYKYVTH